MHRTRIYLMAGFVFVSALISSSLAAQNAWQSPKQGWLYVLDGTRSEPHILLVDPSTESVQGRIVVGPAPEFTISPNGSKIFVVSGPVDGGEVTWYDAPTGRIVSATNILFRTLTTTWPGSDTVAVSQDGRWLYVETMQTIAEGHDEYAVLRFDTAAGAISPSGRALLPECGLADLIPVTDDKWDLLVFCPFSNSTRKIRFAGDGTVSGIADIDLPSRPYSPAYGQRDIRPLRSVSVLHRENPSNLTVLTASNEVCTLSLQGGAGPCSSLSPRMQGRWIPERSWPHSPDGRLIYVGSGPIISRSEGMATSIEVIDTDAMKIVSSIDVSMPFWRIAAGRGGEKLYATNPVSHTIIEIDATAKKEIREILIPNSHPSAVIPVT